MVLDCNYWETRHGEKKAPSEMSTEHILNTLQYLRENVDGIAMCYRGMPACYVGMGEGATYYADQSFYHEMNKTNMQWITERKIYKLMEKVLETRGISVEVALHA